MIDSRTIRMRRSSRDDERGVVLVWMALMIVVLLGMCGISLDIANWYLEGSRQLKAADAAALAGAVYLPDNPSAAFAAARDLAGDNGYTSGGSTTVTVTQEPRPSQLRVTITRTIDNFFGALLRLPRTTITRTSVAEFVGPVPMGSPANSFGDEPTGATTEHWSEIYDQDDNQPQFWANIAGPQSVKINGDAQHALLCPGADNCAGSNGDYNANGYFYVVRVPSTPPSGRLAIEVYDPAFVNVGDHCTQRLAGATASTNPFAPDAAVRYGIGDTDPSIRRFCNGDQLFDGSSGDGVPPTTSIVLRSPSLTPWDPTSFPVMTGACAPKQYRGYDEDLAGPLDQGSGNYDATLAANFRQWVRVCTINDPVPAGDYLVQVRTNVRFGANPAGPADLTTPGGGHNRFAIRAAFVNPAGNNPRANGISIFGNASMSIYVNAQGADTQFHLARVPSGSGDHVLSLNFFDVSDASGPGTLRIIAPPDATEGPSGPPVSFADCTGIGPAAGALPTCEVRTDGSFNGRWQTVKVPIPADYRCDDLDPEGCWVRVEYDFADDITVQDTTTWTAAIEGDPVRLVE
jgi:Flp pilus assembly protein TadG